MKKEKKSFGQPPLQTAVCLVFMAIIVLADFLVKRYATNNLMGKETVLIPKILSLVYTTNDGAAWSILRGKQVFFYIITVVVLAVVVVIYVKGLIRGWFGCLSLAACVGGAIGNFIDRIRFGYVVDMFKTLFMNFPIFNVADSFLTLGCIALAVYILFFSEKEKKPDLPNPTE